MARRLEGSEGLPELLSGCVEGSRGCKVSYVLAVNLGTLGGERWRGSSASDGRRAALRLNLDCDSCWHADFGGW